MPSDAITGQQILDRVWTHFVVEERPRGMRNGRCSYRGEHGPCAVGLFLGDDEVAADRHAVGGMFNRGLLPARLVPHLNLLASLQIAHDNPEFDELERRPGLLRRVAQRHGLTTHTEVIHA